ncbi:hypothetical protein [Rathayibacter toxicus]|nr:hypothetical protein [Rathayibacter toxicus]
MTQNIRASLSVYGLCMSPDVALVAGGIAGNEGALSTRRRR